MTGADTAAGDHAQACLMGYTGFVGQSLMRQRDFAGLYNSANIADLPGRRYTTLICAAAPATMWQANANPEADKANLRRIVDAVRQANVERIVLISTIAVYADPAAGCTEIDGRYETSKAYGRHRRELELELAECAARLHALRLPALFGQGLKKNFVFDLINPVPTFLRDESFARIGNMLSPAEARLLHGYFRHRADLAMWELDRGALNESADRRVLEQAFERTGFAARNFTNSASQFQYYNLERLAGDIDWAIAQDIGVLNVCSSPLRAGEICLALTGEAFEAGEAAIYREDMRSEWATRFGGDAPYLYGREAVLADLKAFYAASLQ